MITGGEARLEDLVVPMSSFQARFRSGSPSYLAVIIPTEEYSDDIIARTAGDLIVYMVKTYASGNVHEEQLGGVDIEDIRVDQGASSCSITVSGHRTETFTAKTIALEGASYKNLAGGKLLYRCAPNMYLRPGDTVQVNGDEFTADLITWAIGVGSETMEVSQA